MLGYFRLSLAILVSFNHLWIIYGVGRFAVFSFYVISGYLMTAIIKETYGTSSSGLKRYATNRLLRIYPSYLATFAIFAVVFFFFDRATLRLFNSNISTPSAVIDWLKNITLMGLDYSAIDRTIPPSWTLFVELFYYTLIPLLLIAGQRAFLAWLAIAIGYHVYVISGSAPTDASYAWETRYGSVMAGSLGFAIGACARTYMPSFLKTKTAFCVCLAVFVSCYVYSAFWALTGMKPEHLRVVSTLGYYGVMLSAAPIVDYLAGMPKNKMSETFGEFSYPFYLLHIPVGFVVFYVMGATHKNPVTLILGITASVLCSGALVLMDRKISIRRSAIRTSRKILSQQADKAATA